MPNTPNVTLVLTITRPGQAAEVRTITASRTIIGRESGDIVLADEESSALHAEIDCSQGHVIVRDLGSSNGTWRDGKRLPQFALLEGQSFVCGKTELRLDKVEGADQPKAGQTAVGNRSEVLGSSSTVPRESTDSPSDTVIGPTASKQTLIGMPSAADSGSAVPPSAFATLAGGPDLAPTARQGPAPIVRTGSTEIPGLGEPAPPGPLTDLESSPTLPFGQTKSGAQTPVIEAGQTTPAGAVPTPSPAATPAPAAPVGGTDPAFASPDAPTRSDADPVFRAPVSNAVIKDPAAVRGRTGGQKVVPTRRKSRWGRWLVGGGLGAAGAAAVVALGYFIFTLLAARGLSFTREVAAELPEDTIGFVAASSPDDFIELFGDEFPEDLRASVTEEFAFDVLDSDAWRELGVDPDAPVAIALLDADPIVIGISIGVDDREKLAAALAEKAASVFETQDELTWSERSFGEADGLWLQEPMPAAVVYRKDRAMLVLAGPDDGGDLERDVQNAAELLAELRDEGSLADRPGFAGLVPPPGDTILAAYVDGASARANVKGGGVAQMVIRKALADIDGFAALVSHDGPRIHATYETIVREGSRDLEFATDVERTQDALARIPAPVLAAFDGVLNPEALDRSLGDVASLGAGSLSFVESAVKDELGVDLREEVVENLSGSFGVALLKLPSEPDGTDFGAVAWIGVADQAQAEKVAERIYGKAHESVGAEITKVSGVSVYEVDGSERRPDAAAYIHDGYLWMTLGDVDEATLLADDPSGFLEEASHPSIAADLDKGGVAAGFVDVAAMLEAVRPLLDEDDREELDALASLLDPLQTVTLRSELKKRTWIVRQTLHTSVNPALPTLVQTAARQVGTELAEELAAARREKRCAELSEHLVELTRKAVEESGADLGPSWELQRQLLEGCNSAEMSAAQLDCYFAASTVEALVACDAGGSKDGPTPVATDEPDPKPVPYVEDIWPNTQDDADSEFPQNDVNYAVGLGRDPQFRGSDRALVTIVEFGDFECQYCERSTSVLDQVLAAHGDEVRVVFRHHPLESHPNARTAARAALAAGRQGKFWAMHDKLFENRGVLSEENFRTWAEELGLDMVAFDSDYHDADVDRKIQRDIEAAEKFGATGTPVFFINGRYLPGAQPKGAFDALIEEELKRAKTFVERRGNTRKGLYDDMIGRFAPEVVKPKTAVALPDPDETRYIVSTTDLPRRGAAAFARVQLVECGDFDCPFCARSRKTIDDLLDAYPSQIAFYFAHNPLSWHANAEPAARAAAAANAQGKFWEMHDLLFEDQDARDESDFISMARRLSLDIPKFKEDFAAQDTRKEVERQQTLCTDNEAQGTPTFFVNGRRVAGAQTLEAFKAIVDGELAAGI